MANGRWTPERAARVGYLADKGCSIETAMSDYRIAAKSERALRCAASRWGLTFGLGGGTIAVQLSPHDRDALTMAAGVRGVSTLELTTKIMHAVLGARLVDAVLDDRDGDP
jgi:hypothetical protein